MDRIVVSDLPIVALVFGGACVFGALVIWRYADSGRSDRITARYGRPGTWTPLILIALSSAQAVANREWIWVGILGIVGIVFIYFALLDIRRARVKN